MVIDITREVGLFFNLIFLGIGLDFIWCGYWFLKTNEMTHLPKLLGYLVLKLFERANKMNKSKNKFAAEMFSMKAASIYMLLEGPYLVVSSTLTILDYFHK
jgi:hypothetical protein